MADVAATLALWSSTTASNSPAGGTAVGTGLDDNLRELQGVVVRGLSHKGNDIASATSTDIGAVEGLLHDITGTTTITSFGTVRAGILKVLKFEGALTLTHNATSLILPSGANITTADGDIGVFISEGSGNWRCVSYQKATGTAVYTNGEFRSVQTYTSSDTWTKPAGLRRVKVTVIGGGGGGGQAPATGAGGHGAAGGGGAGATAIKVIEVGSLGSTETVTVGAGGASANAGGTSSFGSHCSATGGGTSTGASSGSSSTAVYANGGAGGAASSGDLNIPGEAGGIGFSTNITAQHGKGGKGGNSTLGSGGAETQINVAANAAGLYGSGGSGSANGESQSARAGGAGSAGVVIVEEFF